MNNEEFDFRFTPKKVGGWWQIVDNKANAYVAKTYRDGKLRAVRKKSMKAVIDLIVQLEQNCKEL